MKRLLITILTICCLTSSISASSLLFTPHHVSIEGGMAAFDDMGSKDALLDAMHVDSEGKRETVDSLNPFSFKNHCKVDKFFLDNNFGSSRIGELNINRFNSTDCTGFHVSGIRIIIFPFHSFW